MTETVFKKGIQSTAEDNVMRRVEGKLNTRHRTIATKIKQKVRHNWNKINLRQETPKDKNHRDWNRMEQKREQTKYYLKVTVTEVLTRLENKP